MWVKLRGIKAPLPLGLKWFTLFGTWKEMEKKEKVKLEDKKYTKKIIHTIDPLACPPLDFCEDRFIYSVFGWSNSKIHKNGK